MTIVALAAALTFPLATASAAADSISRPGSISAASGAVTKQGTLRIVRKDAANHGAVSFSYLLVGDDGVRYKVDFGDPKSRVVNSPAGTGRANTRLLEPLSRSHLAITGFLSGGTLTAITTRGERANVAPVSSGESLLDRIAAVFNTWASPLIVLAFIALIVISLRFMPRQKPQRIKPQSSSSVKWDDVAGCEEAKHELREVVEFLREPDRFRRLGANMPKGILLHGPPGTGKTLLAKAVAHESGANFFSQSASSFVEMFAGLGAARIRRLFREARKHAPAILFIDELDAVGLQRGFDLSREKDQTLNQLLVEMDGFDERGELVVLAASNRAEGLDPALMRPGRFDRQVLVSPPDLNGRLQILGVHTRGKPVTNVDLRGVARQTSGLTGADLANLCNEAAIFAGRTGRDVITDKDFDGALERVVAGLQTRRVITPDEKKVIAYHEAGHALVGELLRTNVRIHRVSIVPRGQALGYVMNLPEEDRYLMSKEDLLHHLSGLLGGYVAELIVFGRTTTGAADDLKRVVEVSRAMIEDYGMGSQLIAHVNGTGKESLSNAAREVRDREQQALIDQAQWEARVLVSEYREVLDAIAARLIEKETLDRDEIEKVIAGALESSGKTFPEREQISKYDEPKHDEPSEQRTRTGRFDRSESPSEVPEV